MAVISKPSSAVGLYFMRKLLVATSFPIEASFLQLVLTFPFNVLLVMTMVLIVGIIRIFTKKPTRINHSMVDMEKRPEHEVNARARERRSTLKGSTQWVEEEIPKSFEGSKEGVVELYTWFYRFAQGRLGGIGENMTPRELLRVVSGRIPSQGALPLEYLVTSFEIANYSKKELTREIQSKCLNSVEVLKNLIEGMDSRMNDNVHELDGRFSELDTHNALVNKA
jgi:hypothetical protein